MTTNQVEQLFERFELVNQEINVRTGEILAHQGLQNPELVNALTHLTGLAASQTNILAAIIRELHDLQQVPDE